MDWIQSASDGNVKTWIEYGEPVPLSLFTQHQKATARFQRVMLLSFLDQTKRLGDSVAVEISEYTILEKHVREFQHDHPLLKDCRLVTNHSLQSRKEASQQPATQVELFTELSISPGLYFLP